jgi:hypothetical protein
MVKVFFSVILVAFISVASGQEKLQYHIIKKIKKERLFPGTILIRVFLMIVSCTWFGISGTRCVLI